MRANVARLQTPTTEQAQFQKGSVLVEFALILPVFLTLLFGMITFSIALYNKTVLTMATRKGARAGALYVAGPTATAEATRISRASVAAVEACANVIPPNANVLPPTIVTDTNGYKIITVTANINYTGLFWDFISYTSSNNILISTQTSMRLESQ